MRNRACLASLLLVSACATAEEDIWLPNSSDGGKADGVRLCSGYENPSRYIDYAKLYICSRDVATWQHVGAIDPQAQSIVDAADGIFAHLPANGRLEAWELYRVEQTIADADPDALRRLWTLLEIPKTPAARAPGLRDTAVIEKLTPPKLQYEESILIASLPVELHAAAQLVEQQRDHDNNPATIHRYELDLVTGVSAEVSAQLDLIRREWIARAGATGEAAVLVPTPGTGTATGSLGGISFQTTYNVRLREKRTAGPSEWTGKLELLTDVDLKVETAPGDVVVFVSLDEGHEIILTGPTANVPTTTGGAFLVERFHAGQRTEHYKLLVPHVGHGRTTDLSRFLDFIVYGDAGILAKNVVATSLQSGAYHVEFDYATTTVPVAALDQAAVTATATPTDFAVGRYRLFVPLDDGITTELQPTVYPNGVVRLTTEPCRFAMRGPHKAHVCAWGTATMTLVPATRQLHYSGPLHDGTTRYGTLTVESWMRTYN